MVIGIGIFSLTLSHKGADGVVRTGLDGLAVYLIPNFEGLTPGRFLEILLDAMSQLLDVYKRQHQHALQQKLYG